jgi:5S rRNA maturation endonuclease (ribonuclease M5)
LRAAELAAALGGKKTSTGWMCRCPSHDDSTASLSIADGDNGTIVKCFASCSQSDVIAALDKRGLWERKTSTSTKKRIVATYAYKDADGRVLYEVVRFEPKGFAQRRYDSNGQTIWNVRDIDKVPYHMTEMVEAIVENRTVFIVEGEKDADNLAALGVVATCNPGGANKWQNELTSHFKGADVVIVPDGDGPGRDHGQLVANKLNGTANSIRVLELPKKDASDWIASGGTSAELFALAKAAPAWKPATTAAESKSAPTFYWHGEGRQVETKWLVKNMLPEVGVALMSGQWGMLKSFAMLDLSAALVTEGSFAGHRVKRQGGVLIFAAEGAFTIDKRLAGLVETGKLPPNSPIVWTDKCPPLLAANAFAELERVATAAKKQMLDTFGVPLVMIAVDTVAAAAGFKDENDNAEAQRALNVLADLAKRFECCCLGLDHFGKNAESGTRGGSAKEGAVDAVLALLGERTLGGKVSNSRLTIRKLRDGETGAEVAFVAKQVRLGDDEDGEPVTTLAIEWQVGSEAPRKVRWSKGLATLRKSMMVVTVEKGQNVRPYGAEGPMVRAVDRDSLRTEYYANWAGDSETEEGLANARRQAFNRELRIAAVEGLIGVRDKLIWLVAPEDEAAAMSPTGKDWSSEDTPAPDRFN